MSRIQTNIAAAIFAIAIAAAGGYAQGTLQKTVHYVINTPHAVEMGGYLLPAGTYTIHQINVTDPNLFALYKGDKMEGTPVASLRTTRIDYKSGEYPEGTKFRLEFDETANRANPVLMGWSVPGEDGWKVIAVDADDDEFLVRVQ